jgi:hypothetical protein
MKILTALLIGLLCSSLGLLAEAGMEAFYDNTPEVARPEYFLILDAFTPVTWWSSWIYGALVALAWGTGRHDFPTGCYLAVAVVTLLLSIISLIALPCVLRHLTFMNGDRDVPSYRIAVNVLIFIGLSIATYKSIVKRFAEQAVPPNGP